MSGISAKDEVMIKFILKVTRSPSTRVVCLMSLCPQAFEETEAFERHGELPQDLTDSLEWMERHSEQEPTNSLIFQFCSLLSSVSLDWKNLAVFPPLGFTFVSK